MRVVLITPVTPYKENMGGPSGNPYHLMIERPNDIDITIYCFNSNNLSKETISNVEKELRVKINLVRQPRWITWIIRLHLSFIRLILKYPIGYYIRLSKETVKEIESQKPDLIWAYSQEFSGILKQFRGFKRLHTLADCFSLHWYRRLGLRFTISNIKEYLRCAINYHKHYLMERDYDDDDNITYHLVGEEDVNFLREVHPGINAHFIHHPLYKASESEDDIKTKKFHSPKRILVAGKYDFYMHEAADELFAALEKYKGSELKGSYVITFLGKGWNMHVSKLQDAGWNVKHIKFAPDYLEEIRKHDIQITPIAIGTGTKGKVLDALSNGLLVIGTPYAMENIAVENGKSCIIYKKAEEVIKVLKEIIVNPSKFEIMAKNGQRSVLKEHNRKEIAKRLFQLAR